MMLLAHVSEDGRSQTLLEHLENTATLCARYAGKIGLEKTGYLAGLLHDSGKAGEAFQAYIRTGKLPNGRKINHSSFGGILLSDFQSREPMREFTQQLISVVIFSHHSGLLDCVTPGGDNGFEKRLHPSEEFDCEQCREAFLRNCVSAEQIRSLFEESVQEVEALFQKIREQGHFGIGMAVKFLFSCLVDADRYDTYCFEVGQVPNQNNPPDWQLFCACLEEHLTKLNTKDSAVNRVRQEISEECLKAAAAPPGVYQFYGPTGCGKTLASFRFALTHSKNNHMERIFYIIPYCSIIDQNSKAIRDALGADAPILEHHSNVIFEDSREGDEQYKRYELMTQRWDSPVILTTMVQLMDTLFAGKTKAARRLHELANSVLIFDEIQTIPVKCIWMFNEAVRFLTETCKATVVLCTATQPQLSGITEHPLRLTPPVDLITNVEEKFRKLSRTKIMNMVTNKGMSIAELAVFLTGKLAENDTILAVLNTKCSARELFTRLKEGAADRKLFFLSTNLCMAHRRKIIEEIKALPQGVKAVCVSTQLIEAGVDLSFDCVIRSLAGLESIAQAAGRCNRNGEHDRLREVYVVRLPEEKLSRLPEIKCGQTAASRVLDRFSSEELLTPAAIACYYEHYYYENELKMRYNLNKKNTSVFELLDDNPYGVQAYRDAHYQEPPLTITQAFRTAGEAFHLIDSNTFGVIVPYGEDGKRLIADLCGETGIGELKKLLRKSQSFTVNLYEPELRKLCELGAVTLVESLNLYLLRNGFYDAQLGITVNGHPEAEIY